MSLPLKNDTHYTYADYANWPDEPRYELMDGVAYAMTGPMRVHQEVVGAVFRQIADALDGSTCRPYVAPLDVRLPKADAADDPIDTVVQPDILVVCDASKLDDRGCLGAPDWVIEVLSPHTAAHDQILKRELYERHGVREYWLIHPTDKVVTVYLLENGAYGKPDIYSFDGDVAAKVLPEASVDFGRVAGVLE